MMKRTLTLVFALLICLALPLTAFAANTPRLYDGADILTASEENELLDKLNRISEEYQVDIIIATVDTIGNATADDYVEYFYDTNDYGYGKDRDGVLLLLAMEEREYRILSNGLGAKAITMRDIDSIGDTISFSLSADDYATAFHDFIDACEYQIDGEINGFPFAFAKNLIISLVIGFVVAFIATSVMKKQLKSVRKQPGATAYTKEGSMQVTHANEFYLYRTVNRVKRENKSSNSSGSSRNVGGGKF